WPRRGSRRPPPRAGRACGTGPPDRPGPPPRGWRRAPRRPAPRPARRRARPPDPRTGPDRPTRGRARGPCCPLRSGRPAWAGRLLPGPSALVEEALFDETSALFGRDLDVARGEQEHLVGDPLHPAVERVGEPAGEVDQALGEVGVRALEVEDDRH